MSKIKLMAAGLAVLAAFTAGWTVRGWKADKAAAELAAQAQTEAREAYAAEAKANIRALAAREAEIKKLNAEADRLAEALQEAYENDPKARAWADCALPDAVACLLK